MADKEVRSLEVRLTEYRDSLRSMADQVEMISRRTPPPRTTGQLAAFAGMVAVYELDRLLAADLTNLLDGKELERFAIVGKVPTNE